MSRGGRGGGRGGRGGMRGNPLPFEVDLDLVDGAEGSITDASDENKAKQLFPPIDLVAPRPLTAKDRELVAITRQLKARNKQSVWYMGTREQNGIPPKPDGTNGVKGKGKREVPDAFDSMETYSKRKRAKPDAFVPIDKRTYPKICAELTPAEVMPGYGASDKKKKGGAKKSVTDRLANLDENKEGEGEDADDESVDGAVKAGDEEEDAASEPQDSEFEEDEADDADNDYNAENYFSGGEGDDGSVGGDEADEGALYSLEIAGKRDSAAVAPAGANVAVEYCEMWDGYMRASQTQGHYD